MRYRIIVVSDDVAGLKRAQEELKTFKFQGETSEVAISGKTVRMVFDIWPPEKNDLCAQVSTFLKEKMSGREFVVGATPVAKHDPYLKPNRAGFPRLVTADDAVETGDLSTGSFAHNY